MVHECQHIRLVTVVFLDHQYEELGLQVEIRTYILLQICFGHDISDDFAELFTAQLSLGRFQAIVRPYIRSFVGLHRHANRLIDVMQNVIELAYPAK